VEHVVELVALVEEVHRVLAPGGRFLVTTPHFSCANAYTDPTHRRALGLRTFSFFTEGHEKAYYSRARFRQLRAQLHFHPGLIGRLGALCARWWPDWWEHQLAWVLPGWFLTFELEAVHPTTDAPPA
jgi:SAM-dependent methyltransferase